MLNIGPQELLLILVVALVVVGPQRLPELSRSIGKALRSLRSAQDEMRRTVNEVLEPQAFGDATEDLRKARDEVRDALRPDRPAGKRGATAPRRPPATAPRGEATDAPHSEPSSGPPEADPHSVPDPDSGPTG